MSDQFATKGHSAVMSMRVESYDSLDDFPTPPWATRALIEKVLWRSAREDLKHMTCWEPACGRRIMSDVLEESFRHVCATDVAGYATVYNRAPDAIGSYLTMPLPATHQWMITNPPFNKALDFVEKGLKEAKQGVAILVRSVWLEGGERYKRLFAERPPSIVAQFCERVPMIKGRWSPRASSATSYSWMVWNTEVSCDRTRLMWIPPGTRDELTRADDAERFGWRGLSQWCHTKIFEARQKILTTPAGDTAAINGLEDDIRLYQQQLEAALAHEQQHVETLKAAS